MNAITLGKRGHNQETPEEDHSQKKQKTSEQKYNYFEFIPNEILLEKFKYLSISHFLNLQPTCNRFASLKEKYFEWVASVWGIENNVDRDRKIQTLYKKIIAASKVETPAENDKPPIALVNSETSVPVMFKLYQDQMDQDTITFANALYRYMGKDLSFSSAKKAREWFNDPQNKNSLDSINEDYNGASGLGLRFLPPEIGKLINVKTIDLCDNKLTGLPPEIFKIEILCALFLSNNNFTEIPIDITELPYLKAITLEGNKIKTLPTEFVKELLEMINFFEQNEDFTISIDTNKTEIPIESVRSFLNRLGVELPIFV
ncbi:MAG: hypothetical protein K1000chlam3_01374 [Chlamydiae bacterium]|nr:hypothetical protein [Chlamydiota bacterium]